MTVLVTAASKHGGTDEIAARIADTLSERGLVVDLRKLDEVVELGGYEAYVVGSAIYFGGWMKEAVRFVDKHGVELSRQPTWLFGSGSIVGDPPAGDDPKAVRPALVERLIALTQAREHKLFGGKLDSSKLSLLERLPVRMSRGREGDWRDWQAVDEWATTIADRLRPKS